MRLTCLLGVAVLVCLVAPGFEAAALANDITVVGDTVGITIRVDHPFPYEPFQFTTSSFGLTNGNSVTLDETWGGTDNSVKVTAQTDGTHPRPYRLSFDFSDMTFVMADTVEFEIWDVDVYEGGVRAIGGIISTLFLPLCDDLDITNPPAPAPDLDGNGGGARMTFALNAVDVTGLGDQASLDFGVVLPEPTAAAMLLLGTAALARRRRRR